MAKTDYVSVDQYLKAQPPHVRDVLQRVRAVLKEALPDAQEGISYQIPVLRQQGAAVIYFAGWKQMCIRDRRHR